MNTNRLPSISLLLLAATAVSLPACQLFHKTPKLVGGGMDMFTPVKMRLHPLSRFLPGPGPADATVEGRLEFTDQFNDVAKTAGTAYFELFQYATLLPDHRGDRLALWNFDLNKPDANKEHWDAITRTYLFKLPIPIAALAKHNRFLLAATFTLPNGQRMTDTMPVNIGKPK